MGFVRESLGRLLAGFFGLYDLLLPVKLLTDLLDDAVIDGAHVALDLHVEHTQNLQQRLAGDLEVLRDLVHPEL